MDIEKSETQVQMHCSSGDIGFKRLNGVERMQVHVEVSDANLIPQTILVEKVFKDCDVNGVRYDTDVNVGNGCDCDGEGAKEKSIPNDVMSTNEMNDNNVTCSDELCMM
jgi:hypothetical protein